MIRHIHGQRNRASPISICCCVHGVELLRRNHAVPYENAHDLDNFPSPQIRLRKRPMERGVRIVRIIAATLSSKDILLDGLGTRSASVTAPDPVAVTLAARRA